MLTPRAASTTKMGGGITVLTLLALCVVGQALTPSTYITKQDQQRLLGLFQGAAPYTGDLQILHYSVLGVTLLQGTLDAPQKTCEVIKKNVDSGDVESLYYASSAAKNLKLHGKFDCQVTVKDAEQVLNGAIKETAPTLTIFYAVATLQNLGLKIDVPKVSAALDAALKTDDGPLSHGYAFYAASLLTGDLSKSHDLIEDVVAQADEVDEKYLQFEGGLFTTATVIDSAYKLAAAAKKAPTLTEDKVIKFANYFLSRKHVQSAKNAVAVLSVVKTLTDNKFNIPVAVSLNSQVSVSDKLPIVQVKVSNLLGKSLGKVTVTADTARHVGDNAVVLSKKPLAAAAGDDSLFELDFMKLKPARGFYQLTISVNPAQADSRLIGTSGAELEVKVTTQVAIENVELGVADKEQASPARTTKLQHPNKAANILAADYHQRLIMKFMLKDVSTNGAMTAHQTFVKLTNQETTQEIVFVAESDSSDNYKFDLDVGSRAKDFGYISGKYSMSLIVGDSVIQNPFTWTVADVDLAFPEGTGPTDDDELSYRYSKKPEIKHMFREPEVRPPASVSNIFTVLILLPLVILLLMWLKLGVNVSNLPASLSALGFHLGLAGILALYYCYWVQLDMFETLKYLGLLGIPTFLFGNRLLSGIAAKRK